MRKIRCAVCSNEENKKCNVKNVKVKLNKSRQCDKYSYDESKERERFELPVVRMNHSAQLEAKKKRKEELKRLRAKLRKQPGNKTAETLGLLEGADSFKEEKSRIIKPGGYNYSMPNTSQKHPMTGDLSRFKTTANDGK